MNAQYRLEDRGLSKRVGVLLNRSPKGTPTRHAPRRPVDDRRDFIQTKVPPIRYRGLETFRVNVTSPLAPTRISMVPSNLRSAKRSSGAYHVRARAPSYVAPVAIELSGFAPAKSSNRTPARFVGPLGMVVILTTAAHSSVAYQLTVSAVTDLQNDGCVSPASKN